MARRCLMVPHRRHLISRGHLRASGLTQDRSGAHCPQRMDYIFRPIHTWPHCSAWWNGRQPADRGRRRKSTRLGCSRTPAPDLIREQRVVSTRVVTTESCARPNRHAIADGRRRRTRALARYRATDSGCCETRNLRNKEPNRSCRYHQNLLVNSDHYT